MTRSFFDIQIYIITNKIYMQGYLRKFKLCLKYFDFKHKKSLFIRHYLISLLPGKEK